MQGLPAARRLAAFDLERPGHHDRLSLAPEEDLGGLQTRPGIIVIDEVQRLPGLFTVLRPLLDASARKARYILLGSASPSVVRGVSESLAGRISFLDLSPFSLFEVAKADAMGWRRLWMRGGLPRSFLARSDRDSFAWREEYMRAFVERDLPALGVGSAAVLVRRLLTMLAHWHGCVLNVAELAASLSVSHPTASHYLDLLEGAFMIRRVPPYWANVGKRLVKAPKVYLRDTGVLHQLLSLPSNEAVRSHPKVGASFEGWVIEQVLSAVRLLGEHVEPFYWRTHGGAEVDLLLRLGQRTIPIEVKLGDSPRPGRGMIECMKDLALDRGIVMHGGADSYPLSPSIDALSCTLLARPKDLLKALQR